MAMTIRAKVWRSVRRGDEERCPRVAVALGLLVRPRRTGQSGRGGARERGLWTPGGVKKVGKDRWGTRSISIAQHSESLDSGRCRAMGQFGLDLPC
jgi:hypothetical protein